MKDVEKPLRCNNCVSFALGWLVGMIPSELKLR